MLSKYFVSSFGSPFHHLAAEAAAIVFPPLPRTILWKLSLFSTSSAVIDRPTGSAEVENTCPMSDFLLNECGLCQSDLSTILRRKPLFVRTRSTHTAQKAVRFLRDSGFTEDLVRKLITRNPSILTHIAERHYKPKLELLKTLGLTAQDFRQLISRRPRFLTCSLEKTLCHNIEYLQSLFGSEADVSRVFRDAPQILHTSNGPETFEKRLRYLESFGLQEDEIRALVRRRPHVLCVSINKMEKIMDFFIHTAGLPAKFLLTYSFVLNRSLESRIKPRHEVLKSISAMQPSVPLPSLPSVVLLNEQDFLNKYVKCRPHSEKLLEIYRGKPVDLESIQ